MLSTEYRLRLEFICSRIANSEEVQLEDMIWANKLAKVNTTAATWLRQARRKSENPDMQKGSLDEFMNQMDLGNRQAGNIDSADDIVEFFRQDKPDDWKQRD